MTGAEMVVQVLADQGVDVIFGYSGGAILPTYDAVFRYNAENLGADGAEPMPLIVPANEQGAGFMAATYGRLTGKVGVCLATLGPGATNLVTPAAYAQLGAMPMLMITGQKPIKTSKQGRFQVIDVVDMMRPITKYTAQVVSGDRIPSVVREAFRLAAAKLPFKTTFARRTVL